MRPKIPRATAPVYIDAASIKPRDAIHVASALVHGASELVTFDAEFKDNPFIPCRLLD